MPIMGMALKTLEVWQGTNVQGEEIPIKENIIVKLEIIPKSSFDVVNVKY